jgi:Arc/MetJ-type ribon-helix-helix transcriptional regulator
MSNESRIQVTVKLPLNIHSVLTQKVNEGTYPSMSAALIIALEKELAETFRQFEDIPKTNTKCQILTANLEKKVSEIAVLQATFQGSLKLSEEKDKRIGDLENEIEALLTELKKTNQDKEDLKSMHNNYMLQMQTLINQKSIEVPGAKKPWWIFW